MSRNQYLLFLSILAPLISIWLLTRVNPDQEIDASLAQEEAPSDGVRFGSAGFHKLIKDALDPRALRIEKVDGGVRVYNTIHSLSADIDNKGLTVSSRVNKNVDPLGIYIHAFGRGDVITEISDGTVTKKDQLVEIQHAQLKQVVTSTVDGIRQDFVIEERPAGQADLVLSINIENATFNVRGDSVAIAHAGRKLSYNKLHVYDKNNQICPASFERAGDQLIIQVDDGGAAYPLTIDPTLSDDNWISWGTGSGADGSVYAVEIAANGDVYAGGNFENISGVDAGGIAMWDGSSWHALGEISGIIYALEFNGDSLIVGGSFSYTDKFDVDKNNLAIYDTVAKEFESIGEPNQSVYTLKMIDGSLYMGGSFTQIDSVNISPKVAYWDGAIWHSIDSGLIPGSSVPRAIEAYNGDIYFGVDHLFGSNTAYGSLVKWDGSNLSQVGDGLNYSVRSLYNNGSTLMIGGRFSVNPSTTRNSLAEWDGTDYSIISNSILRVYDINKIGDDYVFGGTFFTSGSDYITKWDGETTWIPFDGGLDGSVHTVAVSGVEMYVGGSFKYAGPNSSPVASAGIAFWDASNWNALGDAPQAGPSDTVQDIEAFNGDIIIAGDFTSVNGVSVNYVARWDGSNWQSYGSGFSGKVYDVEIFNSELYAVGSFHRANVDSTNDLVRHIAKWNGTAWESIGGLNSYGRVLKSDGSHLYVGGSFSSVNFLNTPMPASRIAQWDGVNWSALGAGLNNYVNAIEVFDGNLVAGGSFDLSDAITCSRIASWDGTAWTEFGGGVSASVFALEHYQGNLLVGGAFNEVDINGSNTAIGKLAVWNGSTWSKLGNGIGTSSNVRCINVSGANVYVGGLFEEVDSGGEDLPAQNIAHYDGANWYALGTGVNLSVESLQYHSGSLYVGGDFREAGNKDSWHFAEWEVVDTRAPVVAVDTLIINDQTPPLSGSIDDDLATIVVEVDGSQYPAVNNANGTWSLPDNTIASLSPGVYEVLVTATDVADNEGTDTTSNELTIDLTAPVVSVDVLNTTDTTPPLSGSVDDPGATVLVRVNGLDYAADNSGAGSWNLSDNVLPILADGIYDVAVTATDVAGNLGSDGTINELTIDDSIAPLVTIDTLLTKDQTPSLSGTVDDISASILVEVAGQSVAGINNLDGTWTLNNDVLTTIAEGIYDVVVTATDLSSNQGTDLSSDELEVDITAPHVTISSLDTIDTTPELNGTVNDNDALITVAVDGQSVLATNNLDGTWTLADDTLTALSDDLYEVAVSAEDPAGNIGTDNTTEELRVDPNPPVVTVDFLITEDNTPPLSGTIDEHDATIEIEIIGTGQTLTVVNDLDGTWSLADDVITTLADGSYQVVATATDRFGRTATDIRVTDLIVDTSPKIQLSRTAVPFGDLALGNISNAVPVQISGTMLLSDVVITMPSTRFKVSVDAVNWQNALTLSPNGGTLSETTIYLQYAALSYGKSELEVTIDSSGSQWLLPVQGMTWNISEKETENSPPFVERGILDVTHDPSGNMYITGRFASDGGRDFDPSSGVDGYTPTNGHYTIYITKFNADKSYAWTRVFGASTDDGINNTDDGYCYYSNVAADDNYVYLGVTGHGLHIGLGAPGLLSSYGMEHDGFVIALDKETGLLNTGFGENGYVQIYGVGSDRIYDLAIDEGKLYVAGYTTGYMRINGSAQFGSGYFLCRFNPSDGSLDTTFDSDGVQDSAFGEKLAFNSTTIFMAADNYVNAYNKNDGSEKLTFGGGDGRILASYYSIEPFIACNDQKLFWGGSFSGSSPEDVDGTSLPFTADGHDALIFCASAIDGSIDTNFGNNGFVSLSGPGTERIYGISVMDDMLYVLTELPDEEVYTINDGGIHEIDREDDNAGCIINIDLSDGKLNERFYGDGIQIFGSNGVGSVVSAHAAQEVFYVYGSFVSNSGFYADETLAYMNDSNYNGFVYPVANAAVAVDRLSTRDQTPLITGYVHGGTMSVAVNGQTYTEGDGHLSVTGNTWSLQIPDAHILPPFQYEVDARAIHAGGSVTYDGTIYELHIDHTDPVVIVDNLTTSDSTPLITGGYSDGTLSVVVNAVTYTVGDGHLSVDKTDWSLQIPVALADGVYEVSATTIDLAGNTGSDATTNELHIDSLSPVVTVNTLHTADTTPSISGTVIEENLLSFEVTVDGITYTNGDGHLQVTGSEWSLLIPVAHELAQNVYDVIATAEDIAGTSISDATLDEVHVDTDAPVVDNLQVTISGTVALDITKIEIDGQTIVPDAAGNYAITLEVPDTTSILNLVLTDEDENVTIKEVMIGRVDGGSL